MSQRLGLSVLVDDASRYGVRMAFDRIPWLHLVCGLPGTGKTTLAKRLEHEHRAMRFCPDAWINDIWSPERALDVGNLLRDEVEALQWKVAKRALSLGVDVIIEWGTWGLSERVLLRDEAHALGAKVAFCYLRVDRDTMKARILARNREASRNEFVLTEEYLNDHLEGWIETMQVPTDRELRTYDRIDLA